MLGHVASAQLSPTRCGLTVQNRSYVYKFCSPTRSSLQSGRLPVHVNDQNLPPTMHNPNDPVSGFAAIPRNMTGMATKLKEAGYACHQIGKWDAGRHDLGPVKCQRRSCELIHCILLRDAGMATPDHTPQGRGYDSSFGYFCHTNGYWNETLYTCKDSSGTVQLPVDLWDTSRPAHGENGSYADQTIENYEEWKFGQRAVQIIEEHNVSAGPLFLNYDFHLVHEPLAVPELYLQRFEFITPTDYLGHRQHISAMVPAPAGHVALQPQAGGWQLCRAHLLLAFD